MSGFFPHRPPAAPANLSWRLPLRMNGQKDLRIQPIEKGPTAYLGSGEGVRDEPDGNLEPSGIKGETDGRRAQTPARLLKFSHPNPRGDLDAAPLRVKQAF